MGDANFTPDISQNWAVALTVTESGSDHGGLVTLPKDVYTELPVMGWMVDGYGQIQVVVYAAGDIHTFGRFLDNQRIVGKGHRRTDYNKGWIRTLKRVYLKYVTPEHWQTLVREQEAFVREEG